MGTYKLGVNGPGYLTNYLILGKDRTGTSDAAYRRLYFGSTSYYLELDSSGKLHTNVGITSDASITANHVLAAPNGTNGVASFRALVASDIPNLTKDKISDFPTSWALSAISDAQNLQDIEALTGTGFLKKASNAWELTTLQVSDITSLEETLNVLSSGIASSMARIQSLEDYDKELHLTAEDIPELDWSKITTGNGDLKAIENLSGNSGILKKTAANTWTLIDASTFASADGYLPLTGGTLSNSAQYFLSIKRNTSGTAYVGIQFKTNDSTLGVLGMSDVGRGYISDGTNYYTLLNSNNFTTAGDGNAFTSVSFSTTGTNAYKLVFNKGTTFLSSVPAATTTTIGGFRANYQTNANERKYAVQIDASNDAYVNIPWDAYATGNSAQLSTGTDTTAKVWTAKGIADYVVEQIRNSEIPLAQGIAGVAARIISIEDYVRENIVGPWIPATSTKSGEPGYMPAPNAGEQGKYLRGDGSWIDLGTVFNYYTHPTYTATTVSAATGRVLSAITVDSTGHVSSVGYKSLSISDVSSLESSLNTLASGISGNAARISSLEDYSREAAEIYFRQDQKQDLFTLLENSSNQLSLTVGEVNKKLTIAYASSASSATSATNATNATYIKTLTYPASSNTALFPTFVDSSNSSATAEQLYTYYSLQYYPYVDNFVVNRLKGTWIGNFGKVVAYYNKSITGSISTSTNSTTLICAAGFSGYIQRTGTGTYTISLTNTSTNKSTSNYQSVQCLITPIYTNTEYEMALINFGTYSSSISRGNTCTWTFYTKRLHCQGSWSTSDFLALVNDIGFTVVILAYGTGWGLERDD